MLTSILENVDSTLSYSDALMCFVVSIVLGLILAFTFYKLFTECSQNYIISLILLPTIVQVVIMLVNGNVGTGVAIAGAFALVRFRSLPGTAKEITGIFTAMVIGLCTGMGYLTLAAFITVIVCAILFIADKTHFGARQITGKILRITIPENLDYTDIFDDLFEKYTSSYSLDKVKTTNMGSMYELSYTVNIKPEAKEKDFIDEIRCRNGNLTIILSRISNMPTTEL